MAKKPLASVHAVPWIGQPTGGPEYTHTPLIGAPMAESTTCP